MARLTCKQVTLLLGLLVGTTCSVLVSVMVINRTLNTVDAICIVTNFTINTVKYNCHLDEAEQCDSMQIVYVTYDRVDYREGYVSNYITGNQYGVILRLPYNSCLIEQYKLDYSIGEHDCYYAVTDSYVVWNAKYYHTWHLVWCVIFYLILNYLGWTPLYIYYVDDNKKIIDKVENEKEML